MHLCCHDFSSLLIHKLKNPCGYVHNSAKLLLTATAGITIKKPLPRRKRFVCVLLKLRFPTLVLTRFRFKGSDNVLSAECAPSGLLCFCLIYFIMNEGIWQAHKEKLEKNFSLCYIIGKERQLPKWFAPSQSATPLGVLSHGAH